tara:strand:+ start:1249 stop:1779 length:531 start_codon:yes stop_codon:yes gene_type:complete
MINLAEIISWMEDFVEVKNKDFGGLPPCPYAKEARKNNKIDFVLFPNDRPDSEIEQYIYSMDFDKYDAMLIIFEKDRWTAKETFKIARDLEVKAQRKGILLGEDHPEMVETVGSSKINNGKYIIFFLQNLKQVEDAAEKLRKTSYYNVWRKDNPYNIDNPDNYNDRHNQYKLKYGN